MTRTRAAVLCGILCDVILVLGAPPLLNYSLAAARSPQTSMLQLLWLLLVNLLLLAVCLCGAGAWIYAFFQKIFRATHASVANDAVAMSRKSTVSRRTTPAN